MKSKAKYMLVSAMVFISLVVAVISLHIVWPDWMFLNYSYQEHIDTNAYLVDKEQLITLFQESRISQKKYNNLDREELYVVVRIKNNGDVAFWGTLMCQSNDSLLSKLDVPLIMYGEDKFKNFIFPVTNKKIYIKDDMPVITTKWRRLYTK